MASLIPDPISLLGNTLLLCNTYTSVLPPTQTLGDDKLRAPNMPPAELSHDISAYKGPHHVISETSLTDGDIESLDRIDPAAASRLRWKIDLNVYPILFVIYAFSFLDRINISNARIQGLTEELELYGNRYNIAVFVSYALVSGGPANYYAASLLILLSPFLAMRVAGAN